MQNEFCLRILAAKSSQGQILAVRILAVKLPNSDLNLLWILGVDFFLLFFRRKRAHKNSPNNPPQNSPRHLVGKIPLGFLQKPFFEKLRIVALRWDHSFPLENTKSPHPENPGKLLKNYNLAYPGTVLKITEKLLKNYKKCNVFSNFSVFCIFFSNFSVIFRTVRGGPNCNF